MPSVKVRDGIGIHYEVHDHTDPWSDRPVLILQHGFGRSAPYWYNMVPYLSRHYRVACPTLRGFGKSGGSFDRERPIELEDCLEDLRAIVDDLGVETVHFAGESFGGILGMAFAAQYADRVRTLSLMTAPLYISTAVEKTFSFGYSTWEEALEQLGVAEWARKANSATRFPPDADARLIEWYASETGKNSVGSMVAQVRLLMKSDVTPMLERIRAPALGLYPSRGIVATDEQQSVIKEKIHDIRIVHLPTPYHMVWVLYPAVCARHILHFVALHDGIACVD